MSRQSVRLSVLRKYTSGLIDLLVVLKLFVKFCLSFQTDAGPPRCGTPLYFGRLSAASQGTPRARSWGCGAPPKHLVYWLDLVKITVDLTDPIVQCSAVQCSERPPQASVSGRVGHGLTADCTAHTTLHTALPHTILHTLQGEMGQLDDWGIELRTGWDSSQGSPGI